MKSQRKRRGATRKPVILKPKKSYLWSGWLKAGLVVMVIASVAGGLTWLQQDDVLPVRHVVVEGAFVHVKKDRLIAAVKPYVSGNFLNVDVARLQKAGHIDPWIKQIRVKRQWPDTLRLIITERTATAYWGTRGLIDSEGEVFYPQKQTFPEGLVYFQGPENTHPLILTRYQEMTRSLAAAGLGIKRLKMDARRAWQVQLSNAIVVKLGRADSQRRWQRFIAVYKKGLAHIARDIKTVDMRYTNGLAVSWKAGRPPELSGAV